LFFKSKYNYNSKEYYLFLMGIFHKEFAKKPIDIGDLTYHDKDGIDYSEIGDKPGINSNGQRLLILKETAVNEKIIKNPIEIYRSLKHLNKTIIHGDWKFDNLYHGHVVDYAMVGYGLEIDDLTYYLSDANFKHSFDQINHYIKSYIGLRQLHDKNFEAEVKAGLRKDFFVFATSSLLTELKKRHSVMIKRKMDEGTIHGQKFKEQIEYYKHMIELITKEEYKSLI
ncbi:hypothetical protein ACFL1H_05085, partial [Nanoarchaeota archaeon]